MFYNVELLCRKKRGKFSLIWLAAMGRIKKIARVEIINMNILHVCEELITVINTESNVPTRRFSLYLSAQLVYGTVVCYQQQVNFFMNDLFTLYTRKTELVERIRTLDAASEEPPKKKRRTTTRKRVTRPVSEEASVPEPDPRPETIEQAVHIQDLDEELSRLNIANENLAEEGEITLREIDIPPTSIQRAAYDPFGDEVQELLEIEDVPIEKPKKKSTDKRVAQDELSSISKRPKTVPPPLDIITTVVEHGVVSPITPVVRRMLSDERLRRAENDLMKTVDEVENLLQKSLRMDEPTEDMSHRRDVSQPIVDEMPVVLPGDVPEVEAIERMEPAATPVELPEPQTPARRLPVRRTQTPRRGSINRLIEPRVEHTEAGDINRHTASSFEFHEISSARDTSDDTDDDTRLQLNQLLAGGQRQQIYDTDITAHRGLLHGDTAPSIKLAPGITATQPRDISRYNKTVEVEEIPVEQPPLIQMENVQIEPEMSENALENIEFEQPELPERTRIEDLGPPAGHINGKRPRLHHSTPVHSKKDPNRIKKLLSLLQDIFREEESITLDDLCTRTNDFVDRTVVAMNFGDLLCLKMDKYIDLIPKEGSLELDLIIPGQRLLAVIHE